MQHDDVPVAVLPLSYAEEAAGCESGVRVARAVAWVGLFYGVVRLAMCGIYMLARWGRGTEVRFYAWDQEGWEGLVLASAAALVNGGLIAASVLTLRLMPLGRGAILAYAVGAMLLWLGEVGVQCFYNYTGYYGDMEPGQAAWATVQDVGYQVGHLTFPVLVLLLLRRRGAGHATGR